MLRNVLIEKGLSKREAEVVEWVTKGCSNKEVADRLFVTEKTIKFHLTNIYKKMNVKSRAQLIVWCLPHFGFIGGPNNMVASTSIAQQVSTNKENVNSTSNQQQPVSAADQGEQADFNMDLPGVRKFN